MSSGLGRRPRARRPIVIGITGNIACGKTAVMGMLGELGAELIDADAVYHELIAPCQPLWQALRDRFGDRILAHDRTIDRRVLGSIVFSDPGALADLDRLTHPAVIAAVQDRVEKSGHDVVAVAAVKLVESGAASLATSVWLVICDREQQLKRLIARNGLARDDAERRLAAQPPVAPKLPLVDEVIDNSGTLDETRAQVVAAWERLHADQT
jgi:dephospho-CoA kinase